jgi:hypothetical protein
LRCTFSRYTLHHCIWSNTEPCFPCPSFCQTPAPRQTAGRSSSTPARPPDLAQRSKVGYSSTPAPAPGTPPRAAGTGRSTPKPWWSHLVAGQHGAGLSVPLLVRASSMWCWQPSSVHSVRSEGGDENGTRREASKAQEAGGGDELKSTRRPAAVSAPGPPWMRKIEAFRRPRTPMPPWMHQGPSSRARGRRPAMDPQNPSLPSPGLGFVVVRRSTPLRERG